MKINVLLAVAALQLASSSIVMAGELSRNWGLFNLQHSHIDAPKAWKLASDGSQVKVCVIDTGVDVTHPDLKGRICPSVNGDEFGWDFVNGRKNPRDESGHGTHVAGIIRATSPTACIIPVKWFSELATGEERVNNTIASIYYCVRRGAQVINYSAGGTPDAREKQAIEVAGRAGIVFVAAAGNELLVLNRGAAAGYYPASYGLSNMIVVGASNIKNELNVMSDYGPLVDLAAPGENILSTVPGGRYAYLTGTSQATPFVSGVVAMLKAKYPTLSIAQIKSAILKSVDKKPSLKGKVATGGKLNAYRALLKAKDFAVRKTASAVR